ncbi:hypothetical protein TWF128_002991, partial [Orbilia oligospora]
YLEGGRFQTWREAGIEISGTQPIAAGFSDDATDATDATDAAGEVEVEIEIEADAMLC